jgi:hypothetical protein
MQRMHRRTKSPEQGTPSTQRGKGRPLRRLTNIPGKENPMARFDKQDKKSSAEKLSPERRELAAAKNSSARARS